MCNPHRKTDLYLNLNIRRFTHMKTYLLCFVVIAGLGFSGTLTAQSMMGKLTGKATEEGEALAFGTIIILQDGVLKGGANANEEGEYAIFPIKPGRYTVKLRYAGQEETVEDVNIFPAKTTHLDLNMRYYDPYPDPWWPVIGFDDFDFLESSGYNFDRKHIQQIQR